MIVQEIKLCLAKGEVLVEGDRQRFRRLHLVWPGLTAGTPGEDEAEDSQRDFHDASSKREERTGVNAAAQTVVACRALDAAAVRARRGDQLIFRRDCSAVRAWRLFA